MDIDGTDFVKLVEENTAAERAEQGKYCSREGKEGEESGNWRGERGGKEGGEDEFERF